MIDFHCHLDLYPDALRLVQEVATRNKFTLVVTTSPRAWHATSHVFQGYDNIKVALGMHPEIVVKKSDERALLMAGISQTKFVGEIGLDGSIQYKNSIHLQESIFREVLTKCDSDGGKILSIHSRNAACRVLDFIEQYCHSSVPVLHWFSGNIKEIHRAVDLGVGYWGQLGDLLRHRHGFVATVAVSGRGSVDGVAPVGPVERHAVRGVFASRFF